MPIYSKTVSSPPIRVVAEFMGQYPVIHLSFKNVKSANKEESMDLMKSVIADEFERHNYLLDREFLDELKIQYYMKIQNKKRYGW